LNVIMPNYYHLALLVSALVTNLPLNSNFLH
jgi:hypothetical protein